MTAETWLSLLLGALIGVGGTYFIGWRFCRKIEALVDGGLKRWEEYDRTNDSGSPTGRTVTSDSGAPQ